jgi:hypothetical protein
LLATNQDQAQIEPDGHGVHLSPPRNIFVVRWILPETAPQDSTIIKVIRAVRRAFLQNDL